MIYEDKIRNIIASIVDTSKKGEDLQLDDRLQDFGMNSLSFVSMIVEIENQFEMEFPDDKFLIAEAGTIRQLCEIVTAVKGCQSNSPSQNE